MKYPCNKKRTLFISSKPIQVFNAINIISQLNIDKSCDVVIEDSFFQAPIFFEKIKNEIKPFGNFFLFRKKIEILKNINLMQYEEVFIDSDVGYSNFKFLTQIKKKNKKIKIIVYEEGIGSYRIDISHPIRKIMHSIIGAGSYFGGCKLTSGIYLYNPNKYRTIVKNEKIIVSKIKKSLQDFLLENLNFVKNITSQDLDLTKKDMDICRIYLSNWDFNFDFLKIFENFNGFKIIKPHPHIKNYKNLPQTCQVVNGGVLAEALIIDASRVFCRIFVYHEGSSAEEYINLENVTFVNVNKT